MVTKRKVLFVVPPAVGGAERVTITIAKLLDREKYDIKVLVVGRERGEICRFIPNYMDILFIHTWNVWDFLTFKLCKIFRRESPCIVFSSLTYLNVRVILAAKLVGGIKIIVRNNISYLCIRQDNKLLYKRLYPYANAVVLQTEEMRQEMLKYIQIKESKLHVCFNPIDKEIIHASIMDERNPLDYKSVNYVFVGSVKYTKGLDCLISAFVDVLLEQPNSKLYIVGKKVDDAYYQKLVMMIEEEGIKEKVVWVGYKDNPYIYMKYADCFVLPSRVEGLPNVVLEAMYLKTPVVVTRSVPVIDRIVSIDRGYVVDVEDVKTMAEKMLLASKMEIEKDYIEESKSDITKLFI